MKLDPVTLFTANAMVYVVLTLALWITSRLAPEIAAIRYWTRGHALMASALTLIALLTPFPDGWQVIRQILGNGLLLAGQMVIFAGVRLFFGQKNLRSPLTIAFVTSITLVTLLAVLLPGLPAAAAFTATLLGGLAFACAWVLWKARERMRRLVLLPCLLSEFLMGVGLFGRAGLLMVDVMTTVQTDPMRISANVAGLLVAIAGAVGMALSFWLLITDRLVAAMQQIAEQDALTGVMNRRGFSQAINRLLLRKPSQIAVLMLDIDRFKAVNDTHGHATGDRVLVCIGETLRDSLRATDIYARLGGEEFCVVLRDTTPRIARDIGERIRKRFCSLTQCADDLPTCTLSIGVAFGRQEEVEALMSHADSALYRSKANGRDRLEVWDGRSVNDETAEVVHVWRMRSSASNDRPA